MSDNSLVQKNNRQVAIWLLIGVGMIVVQVLLGGITRLTESGLSITEWKPITGALPPLNDQQWQVEFEKYRHTDQFKFVHQYFSLHEFKFIFFWEWFHRLWARMMGLVFLIGFTYFIIKKKFNTSMIVPMILLFLLGGLQGAIGWIMVSSGLVPEKYFVGHIELTTHFIAALVLLSYTYWFALSLLPSFQEKIQQKNIHKILMALLVLFFIQLMYGGFMAGMKAASTAPTWPLINSEVVPNSFGELSPWIKNLFYNKLAVHFIHRSIAYIILITVIVFSIKSKQQREHKKFSQFRVLFMIMILCQILLGIFTLLYATNTTIFICLGVAHQFTAMLLVMCLVTLLFLSKQSTRVAVV